MTDRKPLEPVQISLGEKRLVPTPPPPPEPPASPKSIPWKKIGERLAAVPKSIPWMKIVEGLAAVRSAMLNGLLLVSLVALVAFAVAELRREVVVIDPIRLPETLREMGYSEDVAADRLWDEMARINRGTPTAKVSVALQPESQKMDFEPPGSGIALQEVVQMLRRFLGRNESRIVGEITCTTTECKPEGLTLTLRVFRGDRAKSDPIKILPVSPIGDQTNEAEIDRYFRDAALELLRELDPYTVAFYLYQTNTDAAEREALQLLIDPTHPDRKWALNLLGFIAADRGDHDAAIGWYDKAVKADKKNEFAIAYYNWGNALSAKGDPNGAIGKFTRATELDPKNAFAYNSWGLALVKKGELAKANGELAEAKDEWAEAIEKFTIATKLDPEYADAYNNWGNALGAKGELAEAIKKYTLATELDPNNAVAFKNKGLALSKLISELSSADDPADAFQSYTGDAVDAFQSYAELVLDSPPKVRWAHRKIKKLLASATND